LGGLLTIASVLFIVPFLAEGQGRTPQKEKPQAVRSEMIVSTAWLAGHLNDPKVVVLHVARERSHYDGGHIPGARFVGWGEITATRDGVPNELAPVADLQKLFERLGIGDDARIVLYGDNSGLSAARAYFTLDYLGHGAMTALLDGGLEKWKAERRAISTDSVDTKSARFTPRVRASAVTNLDVVRDLSWTATNLTSPNVALIDARPVDEYTGTKPGRWRAARRPHPRRGQCLLDAECSEQGESDATISGGFAQSLQGGWSAIRSYSRGLLSHRWAGVAHILHAQNILATMW